MKFASLATVVAALLLLPPDLGRAQSDDLKAWVFFAPNPARRVTITRDGALLATFQVREGSLLVASYDDRQPASIAAGRWEFHGDFRLHAQPMKGMPALREPGGRVEQIRSEAPLVLTVQGADVLMENIDQ